MSLLYLSEQLTIYGGFFIILTGTVGNGMNIFIFSSVRNYRRTPCTFFFLAGSINDTIQLLINLTSRILSAGYGIDFSVTSTVWCKTRPFLLTALGMISLTCASLATVGQFLATSRSVSLRRCNNIKWAHRILCVMIIVWCIYGIPNFFYFNISPASKTCVVTNDNFRNFGTTNIFVFLFAVPISVIITFGYLAYRNMHQIRALAREHADRQLTRMVLIQVVLVVVSITPYAIFNAYNTITVGVVKDLNRQLKEYFALTIVSLISYLHFAVCLFIFS
jgi:hypothetical protein